MVSLIYLRVCTCTLYVNLHNTLIMYRILVGCALTALYYKALYIDCTETIALRYMALQTL